MRYVAVPASEDPPAPRGKIQKIVPVLALFVLVVGCGCIVLMHPVYLPGKEAKMALKSAARQLYSSSHQHFRKKSKEADASLPTWSQGADFASQCPPMEVDVEYVEESSGFGLNYDHIPTPEMCCSMCQGHSKCRAWTWVKDAGLDGCPSQCWLKGGTGEKKKKKGLVSGVPPEKKVLKVGGRRKEPTGGALFCFSLMVPGTVEVELLEWQYSNQASIFGCENFAVYSNKEIEVADGLVTKVIDSDLKCEFGGDSQSALNAWIFIAVWRRVVQDKDYIKQDWVVKADPDAVFFPDRLGRLMLKYKDVGYLSNCKYGLHGPLEVFNRYAIDALGEDYASSWDGKAPSKCVTGQHFGLWGEDMFIDQCLDKMLKITDHPVEPRMLCESHCECPTWYWCDLGQEVVSFHPFKTLDAYKNCMANAMASTNGTVTEEVAE